MWKVVPFGSRIRTALHFSDGLFSMLPKHMCAEILYSPDAWNDYHNGMAYLTAGKMFEEIQLVKD